jgi:hypothetical protein
VRLRTLVVLVAALVWPAWALATRTDVYAIVDARVVTVSGATFERATVVLRDGVIEAVGPNVATPGPTRVSCRARGSR